MNISSRFVFLRMAFARVSLRIVLPFIIALALFSCSSEEENELAALKKSFLKSCKGATSPVPEVSLEKYCPCAWEVAIADPPTREKMRNLKESDNVDLFLLGRMGDSTFANGITQCIINSMEN